MSNFGDSWVTTVEIDEDGESVIQLPEEMVHLLGWKFGDELMWTVVHGQIDYVILERAKKDAAE